MNDVSVYKCILRGVIAYIRPLNLIIGFVCEHDGWHQLPGVKCQHTLFTYNQTALFNNWLDLETKVRAKTKEKIHWHVFLWCTQLTGGAKWTLGGRWAPLGRFSKIHESKSQTCEFNRAGQVLEEIWQNFPWSMHSNWEQLRKSNCIIPNIMMWSKFNFLPVQTQKVFLKL